MGLHTNSATHTQYTHTQTHETADVFFYKWIEHDFLKKKNEDTQILHTSANFKSYFSLNSCKILVKKFNALKYIDTIHPYRNYPCLANKKTFKKLNDFFKVHFKGIFAMWEIRNGTKLQSMAY